MYLSKLTLNPDSLQVGSDLKNAHGLHCRIMLAFPAVETAARQHWNILFRQEPGRPVILVQSDLMPRWDALPYGYTTNVETRSIDALFHQMQPGQALTFRLRANPTRKENGKRYFLKDQVAQRAWLERKAEAAGFRVVTLEPSRYSRLNGYKKDCRPIVLGTVMFQGILAIHQPDRFINALRVGIGTGRAYGCGMLSIAPVR